MYSALSGLTDWILRYMKTTFLTSLFIPEVHFSQKSCRYQCRRYKSLSRLDTLAFQLIASEPAIGGHWMAPYDEDAGTK